MKETIWLDMDGTIADLYAIEGWLEMLSVTFNPYPYANAKPMVNMNSLAKLLHRAQRNGYHIGIISWLAKGNNEEYDRAVTEAKLEWLRKHLPSVVWDEIIIVPYGTPKSKAVNCGGVLFDDEVQNVEEWGEGGYLACELLDFLREV